MSSFRIAHNPTGTRGEPSGVGSTKILTCYRDSTIRELLPVDSLSLETGKDSHSMPLLGFVDCKALR